VSIDDGATQCVETSHRRRRHVRLRPATSGLYGLFVLDPSTRTTHATRPFTSSPSTIFACQLLVNSSAHSLTFLHIRDLVFHMQLHSPSVSCSLFHCWLKTNLFHKSFRQQIHSWYQQACLHGLRDLFQTACVLINEFSRIVYFLFCYVR